MVKPYLGEGIEDPMGGLSPNAMKLLILIKTRGSSAAGKWVWQNATLRGGFTSAQYEAAVLELSSAGMIEPFENPLNAKAISQGRFTVTPKGMSL